MRLPARVYTRKRNGKVQTKHGRLRFDPALMELAEGRTRMVRFAEATEEAIQSAPPGQAPRWERAFVAEVPDLDDVEAAVIDWLKGSGRPNGSSQGADKAGDDCSRGSCSVTELDPSDPSCEWNTENDFGCYATICSRCGGGGEWPPPPPEEEEPTWAPEEGGPWGDDPGGTGQPSGSGGDDPVCSDPSTLDRPAHCDRSNAVRIAEFAEALETNPTALLDVPCEDLPKWKDVANNRPPQAVYVRLDDIEGRIQDISNASGVQVNLDYFSVDLSLPNGFSSADLLESIRRDLDSFISDDLASFRLYSDSDRDRWISNSPIGSVASFDIRVLAGLINADDLSVITSWYRRGSSWRFTTIYEPIEGNHPVSGTREFGVNLNLDGTYTFYTRGVDRLSNDWNAFAGSVGDVFLGAPIQFSGADQLWASLQQQVASFVEANGGISEVKDPQVYRPNWRSIESYISGEAELEDVLVRSSCLVEG